MKITSTNINNKQDDKRKNVSFGKRKEKQEEFKLKMNGKKENEFFCCFLKEREKRTTDIL